MFTPKIKPSVDVAISCERNVAKPSFWVHHLEILASALFFAISALLAKFAQRDAVSAQMVTFLRFVIGLVVLLMYMGVTRTKLTPRNPVVLISRGGMGLLSAFLFYWSMNYTTITNANLLNRTCPFFVALLTPIIFQRHLKLRDWGVLAMAGVGIWLVINPNFSHVNIGDLIGLGSGFSAALAVFLVASARKSNSTVTVLFFLFGVGTLLSWPAALSEDFSQYTWNTWFLLLVCGIIGAMGQFTFTVGIKYLSAFSGSIMGMSRVVIAAILGFLFLAEVPTWNVVVGSIILFFAIAWLTLPRQKDAD